MSELDGLLDTLAERVAQLVVDKLSAGNFAGYVDQAASPLGRRRHIRAVRSGELRGVQVGRRYLARREDLESYVANVAAAPKKTKPDRRAQLLDELGLEEED